MFEALTLDVGSRTARGVEDGTLPLDIEVAGKRVASAQDKS